ncbi:MAG: hypothetical protein Q4C04_07750 [Clostridia bacterium]|nr:hypothetical protein [Clostridia bacterium]
MKKLISCLLALTLIFSFSALASADDTIIDFSSPIVSGAVGDTVAVDIDIITTLTGEAQINSLSFELRFDADAVRLTGVRTDDNNMMLSDFFADASSPIFNQPEEGLLILAWADTYGSNVSGLFLSFEFEILNSNGSPLTLNDIQFSILETPSSAQVSYNMNPVALGGIAVGSATVPTPNPSNIATLEPTATPGSFAFGSAAVASISPVTFTTPSFDNTIIDPVTSDEPSVDIPVIDDESQSPSDEPDESAEPDTQDVIDNDSSGSNGGGTWWIWLIGGVGVVLVAGAAILYIRQKRQI